MNAIMFQEQSKLFQPAEKSLKTLAIELAELQVDVFSNLAISILVCSQRRDTIL